MQSTACCKVLCKSSLQVGRTKENILLAIKLCKKFNLIQIYKIRAHNLPAMFVVLPKIDAVLISAAGRTKENILYIVSL